MMQPQDAEDREYEEALDLLACDTFSYTLSMFEAPLGTRDLDREGQTFRDAFGWAATYLLGKHDARDIRRAHRELLAQWQEELRIRIEGLEDETA